MVTAVTGTPAAAFDPAICPRLVVKIGSSLLVDAGGAVRSLWLAGVVADLAQRRAAGQQIVTVSYTHLTLPTILLV